MKKKGIHQKKLPKKDDPVFKFLAVFAFCLFLITNLFGTSVPFSERVESVDDVTTSNPVNQIVFGLLFILSMITLLPKWEFLYHLFKKEIFLTLFLLWCFLSIGWSDFPFVSFKRLFQFFTAVIVCLSVLVYVNDLDEVLKYFKGILVVYLTLSIISVFVIPGAIDPSAGSWRGFATSKNMLGQAALISLIIWIRAFVKDSLLHKIIAMIMILISLALLAGSQSMTSILVFGMVAFIAVFFYLERNLLARLKIGKIYSIMVMVLGILLLVVALKMAPDLMKTLPEFVGKDATFTGRSDLWYNVLMETQKHYLKGCGFAAFWYIDNPAMYYIYEVYVWLPVQAHNGYIDIVNELGLIGLGLFILMIIHYFRYLPKYQGNFFWGWFFFIGLLINAQETTFLKPRYLTGMLPVFVYLALFIQLTRNQLKADGSFEE